MIYHALPIHTSALLAPDTGLPRAGNRHVHLFFFEFEFWRGTRHAHLWGGAKNGASERARRGRKERIGEGGRVDEWAGGGRTSERG
eukprot:756487-Hanusia_phi.AAC.8